MGRPGSCHPLVAETCGGRLSELASVCVVEVLLVKHQPYTLKSSDWAQGRCSCGWSGTVLGIPGDYAYPAMQASADAMRHAAEAEKARKTDGQEG